VAIRLVTKAAGEQPYYQTDLVVSGYTGCRLPHDKK